MPVDRVERAQQLGEARARGAQVAPVGVDVLAEQRDLADAVGDHRRTSATSSSNGRLDLAPARRGHDAVGAAAVAADADLHPALERPRAARRQLAGEALELEVPLGASASRSSRNSASLWTWPGPKATSTKGKRSKTSSLTDWAQQPPTPTIRSGCSRLRRFASPRCASEAAVGRLADRAGVEEDQVGLGALRRLAVAERLEHAPHALGVVLVHLAAEGREVVARHAPRVPARRRLGPRSDGTRMARSGLQVVDRAHANRGDR